MTPSVGYGNQYLRLVVELGGVLEDLCIPRYWSKYSRRDFTVHQYVTLLVLRVRERKSYRDFCEWLQVATRIKAFLGLPRVPDYSTLQKQAARLPPALLECVMAELGCKASNGECIVGIDGTGFSLDFSSRYYSRRIRRQDKHRNYLKASITGDMRTQAILASRLRLQRRHDNIDFVPLLRKTGRRVSIEEVVADKGYDSESNHAFTHTELKAESIIPPKYADSPPEKTHGAVRQQLKTDFPQEKYSQRNKVETIFSVIKRCMGASIKSRTHRTKKNELTLKFIAYNCRRLHQLKTQK